MRTSGAGRLAGSLALSCVLAAVAGCSEPKITTGEARERAEASVEAALLVLPDDAVTDEGEDVTLAQAAEGWLACASEGAFPLASSTARMEIGPDDLLVVHAATFESEDDAEEALATATPLCVADVWETAVNSAAAAVGFPADIDADASGEVGDVRVTSELAGFPIGFEGRAGRVGLVVAVVLGGGSDVDGAAAGLVDDVLAAALDEAR